jgi:hypothetical protein
MIAAGRRSKVSRIARSMCAWSSEPVPNVLTLRLTGRATPMA